MKQIHKLANKHTEDNMEVFETHTKASVAFTSFEAGFRVGKFAARELFMKSLDKYASYSFQDAFQRILDDMGNLGEGNE